MLDKIRNFIPTILTKVKIGLNNMPQPLKYITLTYIFFVFLVLFLYLGCWGYLFFTGVARLSELLPFAQLLIGNSMVMFISFIMGLFIDANGDGVPDSIEKDKSNKPLTKGGY